MLTKSKVSFKKLINPVTIALVAGAVVGLSGIQLPKIATTFLNKSSACMSPVSMLLTGMVISQYDMKEMLTKKTVYFISAMRLLIIPFALGGALLLLGLKDAVIPMLMLMAMPCGMNTIIFPKLVGEDCQVGASLAFVTNILCCLTIPLCLLVFGGF